MIALFVVIWAGIGAPGRLLGKLGFARRRHRDRHRGGRSCCELRGRAYTSGNASCSPGGAPAIPTSTGAPQRRRGDGDQRGLPKPQVYVILTRRRTHSPPGSARTAPDHGQRGSCSLNRDELEGVVGHEMSHIKNYDVRLILIVSTLIGFAALVGVCSGGVRSSCGRGERLWAGRAPRVRDRTVCPGGFVVGPLIRLRCRNREELADVSGVNLTRNRSD